MAKKRYPILLSVGSLTSYGYDHVGSLEVLGCCKFDVWQLGDSTAISIVDQCAECVGKLRSMLGSRPEPREEDAVAASSAPGEGPWLLAVVDEADSLHGLSELLREDGFHVEGVSSASAALDLLAERSDRRPCLILIDLTSPEQAGWQLAKELDAEPELATLPRCIVASDTKPGFSLFATLLPQPLDVDRLFEVVHRFCGREAAPDKETVAQ